MFIRLLYLISICLFLCSCSEKVTSPFYVKSGLSYDGAFYPLTFQVHNLFVGNEKAFISNNSIIIRCDGTPIQKLGGYLYLTSDQNILIINPKSHTPTAEVKSDYVFEYKDIWRTKKIKYNDIISVDTKFLTSIYSKQNQC